MNAPPILPPRAGDPAQADRARERWLEQLAALPDEDREAAGAFADGPEGRRLLGALFGNSPFLSQAATLDPAFAWSLFRDPEADSLRLRLRAILDGLAAELAAETDTGRLMAALRIAKRRTALLVGLADVTERWTLEEITGALSDLAETALRLACTHLLRSAVRSGAIEVPDPERPEVGSGLIVLGMGKLGARELNYSSDIDLIVLYDDGVVRTSRPDDLPRAFVRLARELVRIMEERTRDGYVFRTDLRLRPDPGATPLAMSVSAAEAYYGSLGQNWERAAMIKARPVAGDLDAGRAFVRFIGHWVWRRSLDFAAIQDIHSIKRQINAHRGYRGMAVEGHNVKLGHGGIREIEFFAQTQQLIFGGRDPTLRTSGTVESLRALVAAGRVDPAVADDLIAAYRFLRRVEHRLQMVDDRQTHELPRTEAGIAALATFLGYPEPEAFRADLLAHLGRVADHYARLFSEAPSLSGPGSLVFTGTDDDPETLRTLSGMGFSNPSGVAASVRAWHHGRYRATRSTRARELLTELAPTLLASLGAQPSPDAAFMRFDAFLARLPAGLQLFSLFYANPRLLDLVAEIMGTAPQLAEALSRKPALLDAVLEPGFFDTLPGKSELARELDTLIAHARDFEEILDVARRWASDQKFRVGVHILRNITEASRCGGFLADIADTVLAALLERVADEFAQRHGRFPGRGMALVAMGKLGGRQMSIRSDVDLMTVYDVPADALSDGEKPLPPSQYFMRLTQRLTNAITAQTAEGRLYEVDMRLRPSGNAGPLATSLEAFARYQRHDAWTWEHMALTRARVVDGPPDLCARIDGVIRDVLTRPRDPDRLLRDVADMRRRIEREHGTTNVWDVKYVRGGFVDIEFVSQYLMLRHAHERPEVLSTNTMDALLRLESAGFLAPADAEALIPALRLWRRVQGFLRLTSDDRIDAAKAPVGLRAAIARAALSEPDLPDPAELDFARVEDRIREVAARSYEAYRRIVEAPAAALPPIPTEESRTP